MAAIVIRDNAKATWLTGLACVHAKAASMIQRAMACTAATILICAVAAALFQWQPSSLASLLRSRSPR